MVRQHPASSSTAVHRVGQLMCRLSVCLQTSFSAHVHAVEGCCPLGGGFSAGAGSQGHSPDHSPTF